MDQNLIGAAAALISVAGVVSGIILGWSGRSRTFRQDLATDVSKDARLQTDMDYIKRGVDDMRVEIKVQGQRFDLLAERVTRLEESTKQAHHRLNRIEGTKGAE